MQQQRRLGLEHGVQAQRLLGAKQRRIGLERDDPRPALLGEALAQLAGRGAQLGKIVMDR